MQNPTLYMTDAAAFKVFELIQEEGNFNLKLRVSITGGGCSGFSYFFTFDEVVNEDDIVVTKILDQEKDHFVQVLVDSMSLQYLMDAEIDYKVEMVRGIEEAHFIINNPNAKTTCGCGSSFSA